MASPAASPIRSVPVAPRGQPAGPRVSVVIPLFDKRESIGRAVASVLGQGFADFELIVVDDGSRDGGAELVAAVADERIRLIRQPNAGAAVARNRGILAARGEYVALLDADDEWAGNFLATMVGILDANPEVPVVGNLYRVHESDGVRRGLRLEEEQLFPEGQWEIRADFFELARAGQPLHSSSVMLRRSFFASCGLFPSGISHGEDLDLWLRVGLASETTGMILTRRTWSIWHREGENLSEGRRTPNYRMPAADRVLASPQQHRWAALEYAHMTFLWHARRLRLSGHRWASLQHIWRARRTRAHRRLALRELCKLVLHRRLLPS